MRRKKVWRYYCEFCKKANCSGTSIKKHEQRCTLNPDRHCGFCGLTENDQPDLQEAMKLLPEPSKLVAFFEEDNYYDYSHLETAVKETLPKLRDFVNNCPACIMAALRQKGIPVPCAEDFDFKKECQGAWADFNESQRDYDY